MPRIMRGSAHEAEVSQHSDTGRAIDAEKARNE
jgi:hypothetical protein